MERLHPDDEVSATSSGKSTRAPRKSQPLSRNSKQLFLQRAFFVISCKKEKMIKWKIARTFPFLEVIKEDYFKRDGD